MLTTAATEPGPAAPGHPGIPVAVPRLDENQRVSRHIAETLALLQATFAPQRRIVHAGDLIYQTGERFAHLYVLNSGFFKLVNLSFDGREQVVGLKFRGDWLGFDGIAGGAYTCDAVAMDTGEVWTLRYDQVLARCAARPELLKLLHEAMSREISRDRDSLMSVCRRPRRRLPALLGRVAGQARAAHRPDHAAHDPRRDRQLPRHDAGDGEPFAVAAGPLRVDRVPRQGPARDPDSAARRVDRVRAAQRRAGRHHAAVVTPPPPRGSGHGAAGRGAVTRAIAAASSSRV
jgi:CRP-like cAMP-binding protein